MKTKAARKVQRPGGPAGLGLAEAAAALAERRLSSEELVADCLSRIAAHDPELRAWAFVDPDLALAQARACDAAGTPRGPLHGLPIGVKDVLDTKDMPTEYGSDIYRGHRPGRDSACVAELRAAGAVILGKTRTTEFASPVPVGVRNPLDFARSPGVSSSGSAAAVADFMVPLANGTQTGGSVILPASFCGLVGFKASVDGLDRTGIAALKPSLDTLGLFARSVADLTLAQKALAAPGVASETASAAGRPRIGLCRTPYWDEAEPCAQAAVERSAAALAEQGYEIVEAELPVECAGIERTFRVISNFEGKRAMADDFRDHIGRMNPWMRETGESEWSESDYAAALEHASLARAALGAAWRRTPLLLTPSTAGEAPTDLVGLSVSSFNRLWTLMHGPTITLPVGFGPAGMPVGLQLASAPGTDAALVAWAGPIHDIVRNVLGETAS
jgi:Asp-tRNA(Asn)/Glu-tRNA(Gln) amidotransferase A subunit family amidase